MAVLLRLLLRLHGSLIVNVEIDLYSFPLLLYIHCPLLFNQIPTFKG
jgi:hypothetical protein